MHIIVSIRPPMYIGAAGPCPWQGKKVLNLVKKRIRPSYRFFGGLDLVIHFLGGLNLVIRFFGGLDLVIGFLVD